MKFFLQGISALLLISLLMPWVILGLFGIAQAVVLAIMAGSILAWLFVGSGFISFYKAGLKPEQSFHKIFLGSIFGRLAAMAAILILIFRYTAINRLPFLISLFIWYFVFQIWEVISFNRLAIGKL